MKFDLSLIKDFILVYGARLVVGVFILIIGLLLIKLILKGLEKFLSIKAVNPSLKSYSISISSILLKILLFITVFSVFGIKMTAFIAVLGAAGLAIGLSFSGTLQNFAGGVMLLLFQPFKVGDLIESQGYSGVVKEIRIFNTILNTPDGRTIILPNSPLSSGAIVNKSTLPEKRIDLTVGISYSDDIDTARAVVRAVLAMEKWVLATPESEILVSELADNSVNLVIRAWVKSENYWPTFFQLNENIKKAFDKEKISIPFPQRDVHIYKT